MATSADNVTSLREAIFHECSLWCSLDDYQSKPGYSYFGVSRRTGASEIREELEFSSNQWNRWKFNNWPITDQENDSTDIPDCDWLVLAHEVCTRLAWFVWVVRQLQARTQYVLNLVQFNTFNLVGVYCAWHNMQCHVCKFLSHCQTSIVLQITTETQQ